MDAAEAKWQRSQSIARSVAVADDLKWRQQQQQQQQEEGEEEEEQEEEEGEEKGRGSEMQGEDQGLDSAAATGFDGQGGHEEEEEQKSGPSAEDSASDKQRGDGDAEERVEEKEGAEGFGDGRIEAGGTAASGLAMEVAETAGDVEQSDEAEGAPDSEARAVRRMAPSELTIGILVSARAHDRAGK